MPSTFAPGRARARPLPAALAAQRSPAALVVASRGGLAESVHYGSVAVVDWHGRLLCAAGDPWAVTFTRSALKPLQALPFVAAGGPEHFGYDSAQTALLCASHSGEARHVTAVADMLRRAGLGPEHLQCGSHAPMLFEAIGEPPPPPPYSPLAHNCSGKHSGMLAYCVMGGWPTASYLDREHPAQAAIRRAVAHLMGVDPADLACGTDGCSAPNYAAPLAALARAYARLGAETDDAAYGAAPRTLGRAMSAHPEMVSGVARSDLLLMQAGRGDWITKIGAEGVQAVGVRSAGIGIAIKIADGGKRALVPTTLAVLERLGLLDAGHREALAAWLAPELTNARGMVTGRLEAVVALEDAAGFALDQTLSSADDAR